MRQIERIEIMSTKLIFEELKAAKNLLEVFMDNPEQLEAIGNAADLISESLKNDGKVISCGNGGAHCDAMHFAEEMTGRFRDDRDPLAAIAISDTSHITCTANDYGFDRVFSRYLRAIGQKGDCLLAISTSGDSVNILTAAEYAKQKGIKVIALTGNKGGR